MCSLLVDALDLEKLILIGSRAEGEGGPDSDYEHVATQAVGTGVVVYEKGG